MIQKGFHVSKGSEQTKNKIAGKVILTTCPDIAVAHHIAEGLLEQKLVACVNLIPQMVSLYRWEGNVQQDQEVQLIIKTTERNIAAIESYLTSTHPYDVPEFVVLDIDNGSQAYLKWLDDETQT